MLVDAALVSPYLVEQFDPGEDLTRVTQKVMHQFKLESLQFNCLIVQIKLPALQDHTQVAM